MKLNKMQQAAKVKLAPTPKVNQNSGRNNNAASGNELVKKRTPMTRANAMVTSEIRAGIQDLRKDRRVARRIAKHDRQKANADYERAKGDLDYVYGETGDYIQNMGQQINQNYTDQASRTAAAQQAFVSALQNNSQSIASGLGGELGRLGLSGVDNSQLTADAQQALNTANQTGMNNQANIALQQQGAKDVSSLLGGMVQGSKASSYGTALNARNDTLQDIYDTKHDAYNQVDEAISDLKGKRGDLTAQMIQQLAQSPWGRYLSKGKRHGGSSGSSHGSSGFVRGGSPYSSGASGSGSGSSGDSGFGGSSLNDLLLGALGAKPPR